MCTRGTYASHDVNHRTGPYKCVKRIFSIGFFAKTIVDLRANRVCELDVCCGCPTMKVPASFKSPELTPFARPMMRESEVVVCFTRVGLHNNILLPFQNLAERSRKWP
jgi:hypothetical protein